MWDVQLVGTLATSEKHALDEVFEFLLSRRGSQRTRPSTFDRVTLIRFLSANYNYSQPTLVAKDPEQKKNPSPASLGQAAEKHEELGLGGENQFAKMPSPHCSSAQPHHFLPSRSPTTDGGRARTHTVDIGGCSGSCPVDDRLDCGDVTHNRCQKRDSSCLLRSSPHVSRPCSIRLPIHVAGRDRQLLASEFEERRYCSCSLPPMQRTQGSRK